MLVKLTKGVNFGIFANILARKKITKPNCDKRKDAQSTLVQKSRTQNWGQFY